MFRGAESRTQFVAKRDKYYTMWNVQPPMANQCPDAGAEVAVLKTLRVLL